MAWVKAAGKLQDKAKMEDFIKYLQEEARANRQQQQEESQANRQLQQAMLQQQEERSRQQQAMLQQQQEESRAMFQLMMEKFSGIMAAPQATTTEGSHTGLQGYPVVQHSARAAVQKALQKMTATDDVEAYLTVFERHRWSREWFLTSSPVLCPLGSSGGLDRPVPQMLRNSCP
ncbi:hypothetical protein GDO81_021362 [Engystomops pustulosus]|uniref:Uncharacterized protein n=1 Tax=Engystomops pustulosus TaxID=76066 RepID=A0AAV6YTL2_ENGPU|nr:hypothetical protein GDO81_021362 [Engystomops pustulosus]